MEKKKKTHITPLHFFGGDFVSVISMMVRYFLFEAYLMELKELHEVKPATLLRFARTLKRFS